jgi:hypothetical protein
VLRDGFVFDKPRNPSTTLSETNQIGITEGERQ